MNDPLGRTGRRSTVGPPGGVYGCCTCTCTAHINKVCVRTHREDGVNLVGDARAVVLVRLGFGFLLRFCCYFLGGVLLC